MTVPVCLETVLCSDAALRDVESNMTRLRDAEETASSAAEHKREEVRRCAGLCTYLQAASCGSLGKNLY